MIRNAVIWPAVPTFDICDEQEKMHKVLEECGEVFAAWQKLDHGDEVDPQELIDEAADLRRGQQYHGGGDSPDVVGLPGIHIECKRVERLQIETAMKQSRQDAWGTGEIPVVMHRRNREGWKVTMDLDEFMNLYLAATSDQVPRYPVVRSEECMQP